ncbi:hypothetical protein NIES2104_48990 [Leptolyngbya sp. NIES-2104]|nr:hypothetical protein NIES2104_48990 [Leptolyngbya sp. NIES-2104]
MARSKDSIDYSGAIFLRKPRSFLRQLRRKLRSLHDLITVNRFITIYLELERSTPYERVSW